jgi:hypothetical protein
MEKLAQFERSFTTYNITTTIYSKEDGLVVDIITPNEHLGGVGVGIPYIRKNGEKSANFHCIAFPAHRDAELAGRLAQIMAKNINLPVVVLLGIHIPNITKAQITELTEFFLDWFCEISSNLIENFFSN